MDMLNKPEDMTLDEIFDEIIRIIEKDRDESNPYPVMNMDSFVKLLEDRDTRKKRRAALFDEIRRRVG